MTIVDTLPDGLRYPIIGLFRLTMILIALAFVGGTGWVLYLAGSWALSHLTGYMLLAIVAPPLAYWALYAMGKVD